MKSKIIIFLIAALSIFLLWILFSYKLTAVPPGINGDESAIAYNSVLLSRTLRDSNGRFLPFFVLSYGFDWHQPVTMYFDTLLFKIFLPSFFLLRASSIFIAILSSVLIFYLLNKLINQKIAFLGSVLFVTTPAIMIHSHIALENIMLLPFVIGWLIFTYLYSRQNNKFRYILFAGILLGFGFYSYKGMRLIVTIWSCLTIIYLLIINHPNINNQLKSVAIFILGLLPFFLIIPVLELKYAGAVFDNKGLSSISYDMFLYRYLSVFDPSFLFVKGDKVILHSTGRHGMLLAASLPLFIIGAYQSIKQKGFFLFSLAAFITAPLLFGFIDSVYRASRLLALIPPYIVITSLGVLFLWNQKRRNLFLIPIFLLIFVNYFDFVNFYWNSYPELYKTSEGFQTSPSDYYDLFIKEARYRNLTPVVEETIYNGDGYASKFFLSILTPKVVLWNYGSEVPEKSILLTLSDKVPNMKKLEKSFNGHNIFVPEIVH